MSTITVTIQSGGIMNVYGENSDITVLKKTVDEVVHSTVLKKIINEVPVDDILKKTKSKEKTGTENSAYIVSSGETVDVYKTGLNYIIEPGGSVCVHSNAYVDTVLVSAGGELEVCADATATSVIEAGGLVHGADTAVIGCIPYKYYNHVITREATVHAHTVFKDIKIASAGVVTVLSGGSAAYIDVAGSVFVFDAARLDAAGIVSGGLIRTFSGSVVNNICVYSGGVADFEYGTTVSQLIVGSGGSAYIGEYIHVASATVYPGGELHLGRGASVSNLVDSGGYIILSNNVKVTYASSARQADENHSIDDEFHVSSGDTFCGATLNSGVCLYISSGGVASSVTVASGTQVYVLEGGLAASATVAQKSRIEVRSKGTLTQCRTSGMVDVCHGGRCTSVCLQGSYGRLFNHGFTSALQISSGARVYTYKDSLISNVAVKSGGELTVSSHATASNVVISSGGTARISSEANISDITVSSGGVLMTME